MQSLICIQDLIHNSKWALQKGKNGAGPSKDKVIFVNSKVGTVIFEVFAKFSAKKGKIW
jgi:hypothetical protein